MSTPSPTSATPAPPEPNSPAELRGVVADIVWSCPEGSGRAILRVKIDGGQVVPVLGRLEGHGPPHAWLGREVHAVGRWRIHETHGPQVQADAVLRAEPRTKEGVVKFLREVLAYADSLARKLWTRFRERAPEVVRTDPDAVAATGLVTIEQARFAARTLAHLARNQEAFLSLATLFAGRRMPLGIITACVDRWGCRAPEVIRRDPYVLMGLPHHVVGFAKADAFYLEFGGDPNRLKRQLLFVVHAIETNRDGHTWRRALEVGEELAAEMAKRGASAPRIVDVVKLGLRAGRLVRRRDADGQLWITTADMDKDEEAVAGGALRLLAAYTPVGGISRVA